MSDLPPAGWYENPAQAGQLRYWDGRAWTSHLANPAPITTPYAATNLLPDTGSWLGETFRQLIAQRELVMAFTACVLALGLLVLSTLEWAVSDLVWVSGEWQGLEWSRFVALGVVLILSSVVWLVLILTVTYQLQVGRFSDDVSIGRSLTASLSLLPGFVGWLLLLFAVVIGASIVFGLVAVLVGPLSLLLFLMLIPAVFFLMIRIAFVVNGLVSRPASMSFLRASAHVSGEGRFWPVTGRLMLLGLITMCVGWVGNILNLMLGSSSVADTNAYVVEDAVGDVIFVDVAGLLDVSGLGMGMPMAVSLLVQVATMLIMASGSTCLYLAVHGNRVGSAVTS
jgi:hypothetical protein